MNLTRLARLTLTVPLVLLATACTPVQGTAAHHHLTAAQKHHRSYCYNLLGTFQDDGYAADNPQITAASRLFYAEQSRRDDHTGRQHHCSWA
jgi:hypothetical protein